MKNLNKLLLKYKLLLLAALKPLGFWGAGAIAFIDSSSIPVPMDLIMAGYAWNDRRHFLFYVLLAAIGSSLGGLIPYYLGRAGGEVFLLRRIERTRYEQLRDRFERQEFLALLIPSMMPPPTPWKLFVFAAGVFEMRTISFMLAVFLGRLLRFGIEALLVIRYGPQIVNQISDLFHRHRGTLEAILGTVVLMLAVVALRKGMERRASRRTPKADAER